MDDWLRAFPAFAAAAAVVLVPGLALGIALRLRGLALVAVAPVASVALLSILAVAYGMVGIQWHPATLVAAVGVITLVIWLGFRRHPAAPSNSRSVAPVVVAAGIAVGAILGGVRLALYVGTPDAVSQTNDAVFHLNALRWIAETGSASSFDITGVVGSASFYPGAWHAVASTVVALTGVSIPVAANAVSLVIVALIWPIGLAWLAEAVSAGAQRRRWANAMPAVAGALALGLLSFPLLMLQWGVLYPYALAVALVPAAAAAIINVPEWMSGEKMKAAGVRTVIVGISGVSALVLAQPAALIAWGVLVASWFVGWVIMRIRRGSRRTANYLIAAVVGAVGAFAVLWWVLSRGTSGAQWLPFSGALDALADIILNGQVLLPFSLAMSILVLVGIAVAVTEPGLRWLVGAWLVFGLLYFLSAAVNNAFVRESVLGPWYADPYRLAALAPLASIPLAAVGLAWAVSRVLQWVRPAQARATLVAGWSVAVAAIIGSVALALAPVVQMPNIVGGYDDVQSRYASNADSFLSPDERELLERLTESVPDGAVVIGNPSAGTGFGYLFSGRLVYPRTWANPQTDAWQVLGASLRDASSNPDVCAALEVYGDPEFVLDFGPGDQTPGRYILPGFTDFAGQPGFELVDQQGAASLWRITACER
tara:strand:- start:6969 stop:8927 length:1959 start_codon:yes stop_codon:yes gene_type:complete